MHSSLNLFMIQAAEVVSKFGPADKGYLAMRTDHAFAVTC